MAALHFALFDELLIEHQPLLALTLERGISAAIKREPAALEMQHMVDRLVEQIAVVADDEDRMGIARQMRLEPQRPFKIEIIGRLVEQQQIRLGEKRRRQRHAHAPPAGKFGAGALLRGNIEAEPRENCCGTRRRRMRADIDQPRLHLGDSHRIFCRFRLGKQPRALAIGSQHGLDQALRAIRRFLRDTPDPHPRIDRDRAVLG